MDYKARVKTMLSEKRYAHTLGVAEAARSLALHYGADPERAEVAAILHDCAKELPDARESKLLHAPLGASIAEKEFGVTDRDVLDAVRYHTTAKADMGLLTKIIYIADYIEPNRDYDGVSIMRELAYSDLDKAILMGLDFTISDLLAQGKTIHTDAVEARNYLILAKGG